LWTSFTLVLTPGFDINLGIEEGKMKRLIVLLFVVCFAAACASAPTSTPVTTSSVFKPTPRIPNYAYYTKRCWPGCHYDSSVIKPNPASSLDEFEGALSSNWVWINEDPTNWTLADAPGNLRIVSHGGVISAGLENAQNVLVRDAPDMHFDIMTKVAFAPEDNYQNASLIVRLEDDSVFTLSRGYCQEGESPHCVGSGIYFTGPESYCQMSGVPMSEGMVTLMLRKAGNAYIGYYYLESGNWIEVSRCSSTMLAEAVDVGLTVTTGEPDMPPITADFDFFALVERH
jgi:beta-xylosidase